MSLETTTDNQNKLSKDDYFRLANAIRVLSMDAVEQAKSGHPGMPMGMADVATVLFSEFMHFDPKNPEWPDRDRFILSAGHGSMLLYALLFLTGYPDMTLEELKNFRQFGAKTAGHPEFGVATGIETTTGPLGQGLANAVGMALAERQFKGRFGSGLVNHYTYCIAGDGCLMEGISHEAASLAGHHQLGKLIVLFDDNGISIDGPTDLSVSEDSIARFNAYGWHTASIDGHDPAAISQALMEAKASSKPSLIAAKTKIGYGAPNKGGTAGSHGAPLGPEEIALTRTALKWPYEPFVIPDDILGLWRKIGSKGINLRKTWTDRFQSSEVSIRNSFNAALNGTIHEPVFEALKIHKAKLLKDKPKVATRVASQMVLEVLTPVLPELLGGSADLTGSNNTKTQSHKVMDKKNITGNYLHYGVREHAMAASMNGMALHGGVIPYGGTFLVFTDYCRPAIRLASLMGLRSIYVMTHDSIGLGEDGPTHQPVEHLASLRVIPNLNVFRPADAIETMECWQIALSTPNTPSIIALTRQNLALIRSDESEINLSENGGYIIKNTQAEVRSLTLVATGSEVSLALEAQDALEQEGIGTTVVSMPCCEIFNGQAQSYRDAVLCPGSKLIVIEAGVRQSWDRLLGENGQFVGMNGFGASAPADKLYKHFGITTDAIVSAAKEVISGQKTI
jgi:transketolase